MSRKRRSSSGSRSSLPSSTGAKLSLSSQGSASSFRSVRETITSVKAFAVAEDKNSRARKTMEDYHVEIDGFGGDPDAGFFAVYDGHGGSAAAEFTKETLHFELEDALLKDPQYKKPMSDVWKEVYASTDTKMKEAKIDYSGCTAVTVLLHKRGSARMLFSANVGDARTVLVRNGRAVRLTMEHKATVDSEVKRIQAAGGHVLGGRVQGMLAVSRALGDHLIKDYVISEPYSTQMRLTSADTHLIMACDGVWDVMEDQEAVDLILQEKAASVMAEKLLRTALHKGTTDNVTSMVIVL